MNLQIIKKEIQAIFKNWPIWIMLGTQDIKLRYRRSTIGPLWITISMLITVFSLGFLYAYLFKIDIQHYFPFLASGIISWGLLSTSFLETGTAFIESEGYIKNQESFMSLFVMRILLRNFIIFAHNILVFIPIIFIFNVGVSFRILMLIPGLFILFANALMWGNLLAIIGTRYRDFQPIIASLFQVIFFITPVMWMPNLLPNHLQWIVVFNPFNQFLNLIRAPLLNQSLDINTIYIVSLVSALGFLLYTYFLNRYKSRIVYWL